MPAGMIGSAARQFYKNTSWRMGMMGAKRVSSGSVATSQNIFQGRSGNTLLGSDIARRGRRRFIGTSAGAGGLMTMGGGSSGRNGVSPRASGGGGVSPRSSGGAALY